MLHLMELSWAELVSLERRAVASQTTTNAHCFAAVVFAEKEVDRGSSFGWRVPHSQLYIRTYSSYSSVKNSGYGKNLFEQVMRYSQ